jgi:hypothetical protein
MNALDEGVERHKQLEEIFAGKSSEDPKAQAPIDWNAELQKVLSRPRSQLTGGDLTIDEKTYRRILSELNRILDGGDLTLKVEFEETLRNDGVYEYTSTGSCDGSQTFAFRRLPALAANPSPWEEITDIPEEAKYNND